jgi:hypothetical protein
MGRPTGAHVRGSLQPLVRGFLTELIELGYSWTAQRSRLRLMAELSCWMAARGLGSGDLTQPLIEDFLGEVRSLCPRERWCSRSSGNLRSRWGAGVRLLHLARQARDVERRRFAPGSDARASACG